MGADGLLANVLLIRYLIRKTLFNECFVCSVRSVDLSPNLKGLIVGEREMVQVHSEVFYLIVIFDVFISRCACGQQQYGDQAQHPNETTHFCEKMIIFASHKNSESDDLLVVIASLRIYDYFMYVRRSR